ncbi:uncharacterized protein LOC125849808 [Solanum stenotomum]|uniref:uncharacterized protein LOC125849808 n=1 Tax=Solanum stenotomum TaxID=172797 RepID=UPI0020D0EBC6|nr:uncharacterized protein LOC125849808 [Solanum stenotomum]
MPPRRAVRGRPARRNVEEQGVPIALEMQSQREVTNVEFCEAFWMLSQVVTHQDGQRDNRQEVSSKEGKTTMLIGDITRLMIHVQQVEKDKLKDREEFKNKRAKTFGNEFRQQKSIANWSSFQQKQKGHALSSASAPNGHFMRECPENMQGNGNRGNRAQLSSVAPPDRAAPRGTTSGTGGETNRLYAINSRQKQEKSPDVVTVQYGEDYDVNSSAPTPTEDEEYHFMSTPGLSQQQYEPFGPAREPESDPDIRPQVIS